MPSQKRAGWLAFLMVIAPLAIGLSANAQPGAQPLAEDKILRMLELRIKPEVIATMVQKQGLSFTADAPALDRLKQANVPEVVLEAVRKAGAAKPSEPTVKPVSYQDILELLRLGVPEAEVIERLKQSPTTFTLSQEQTDVLKKLGATEKLFDAMGTVRTSVGVASELNNLAIVFDCSGSMSERTAEGRTKMEVARQAAIKLVQEIPEGVRLAFIIYGQNRAQECNATQVIRKLEPLDPQGRDALVATIGRLQPVGSTPIALALRVAGEELAKTRAPSGLVLISDGKEMCGGNPASEAATLTEKLKLDFGVQVVGFGVKPDEQQALAEIARAGKGKYYDAPSPTALRDVVQMLARRIEEVAEPVSPKLKVAATPTSTAKPGTDPGRPTAIKLGELVKGRVDPKSRTNQSHYWGFDLPAGTYKAVMDLERSDRQDSNIQATLQWLDQDGKELAELGGFNAIDFRSRGVFEFKLEEPQQGIIRVQTQQMVDYDFGLFKAADPVRTPFFRATPKVTPIELGQTFATPVLDGRSEKTCSAYCSLKLPAGDYKVTADLRRVDGENSNIQGTVEALNAEGVLQTKIGDINEIDTRTVKSFKIVTSEEQDMMVRIKVQQKLKGGLKIEPLIEE